MCVDEFHHCNKDIHIQYSSLLVHHSTAMLAMSIIVLLLKLLCHAIVTVQCLGMFMIVVKFYSRFGEVVRQSSRSVSSITVCLHVNILQNISL